MRVELIIWQRDDDLPVRPIGLFHTVTLPVGVQATGSVRYDSHSSVIEFRT